jgi:hypothetical protein
MMSRCAPPNLALKPTAAALTGRLVGYLPGFDHPAFFANSSVSWVEEVVVHSSLRGNESVALS